MTLSLLLIGILRVSFHVGRLPTRFLKIVGQRCSHVVKHKPPSNHIMVVNQNVEDHGHGLVDFHAPTKEPLTCKFQSPKDKRPGFRRRGRSQGGFKVGPDLRCWAQLVGTYKPYPTRLILHLGRCVLIHTKIWWASGQHGNSP